MNHKRVKAEQPLRTWKVSVDQVDEAIFHARTAAKARWKAYQAFSEMRQSVSFREFLVRSSVSRTRNNGRTGERILVCGKPATRIEKPCSNGIYFMWDGSDEILSAHPTEVTRVQELP